MKGISPLPRRQAPAALSPSRTARGAPDLEQLTVAARGAGVGGPVGSGFDRRGSAFAWRSLQWGQRRAEPPTTSDGSRLRLHADAIVRPGGHRADGVREATPGMRTSVRMTSQGSAIVRFQRALETGNPAIVLAAAHELPKPVQLRDALAILLVLLDRERERYPAAAARFAARLVSERRLSLTEAQLTYAALQALATAEPLPGGEALAAVLEQHGELHAANRLAEWLSSRG